MNIAVSAKPIPEGFHERRRYRVEGFRHWFCGYCPVHLLFLCWLDTIVLKQTLPVRQPINVTRLRSCRFEDLVKKESRTLGTKCSKNQQLAIRNWRKRRPAAKPYRGLILVLADC